MENNYFDTEQHSICHHNDFKIQKQRRILEHYARLDHERQRKSKNQLFTLQNVEGLLTVVEMNPDKLQFIPFEQICSELAIFLQSAKKVFLEIGQNFRIQENTCIILMNGTISRKSQINICTTNPVLITQALTKKKRISGVDRTQIKNKDSKMLAYFAISGLNKKSICRKISSDFQSKPKIIFHSSNEVKIFQCNTEVLYLEFPQISLQKFQNWIQIKQKQSIAQFLEICFGVKAKRTITKLVDKIRKIKLGQNQQVSIQPKTVYMVYKGQLLLLTENYQISLTKNSTIYKQVCHKVKARTKSQNNIIISIQMSEVTQVMKQYHNQLLLQILQNLKNADAERADILQRFQKQSSFIQEIQPIFPTQVLNIKYFEKNALSNDISDLAEQQLAKSRKYCIPRSASNPISTRFRKKPTQEQQNALSSDLTIFMSNYPYIKIVQSETKAHNILKLGMTEKVFKRKMAAYKKFTEEQKKKVDKQTKKLYYMDKVRRLKIKNIAEKQIPNGHKKNFNAAQAQKQISQYTLFKNIIEYPVNGVNQNVALQQRNRKIVQKFAKMSSINSKVERKTVGYDAKNSIQSEIFKDAKNFFVESDNFLQISDAQIDEGNSFINSKQRTTTQDTEFQRNPLASCSFYCTNILNPHLPTQKQIKGRNTRTSHIKYKQIKQESEDGNLTSERMRTKEQKENQLLRLQIMNKKPSETPKAKSTKGNFLRIKTTN